jgi:hypothetical protein
MSKLEKTIKAKELIQQIITDLENGEYFIEDIKEELDKVFTLIDNYNRFVCKECGGTMNKVEKRIIIQCDSCYRQSFVSEK